MKNQFQPLFALRVRPNFDRPRCEELSRQLMETGFEKVRGVRICSGTGQSDSRKAPGALEYLAARQAGMFGVGDNILDDTGGLEPLQRRGEDVLLALASVNGEGKLVRLLSEQGQCVINCNKKYCEQLQMLQRCSLGNEWRAKKFCKMAVKFQTSLRRGMFKKWPRSIFENRTKKWAAIKLRRWKKTRRRTSGTCGGCEKKRRAGFGQ